MSPEWKRFSVLMFSEIDFRIRGSVSEKGDDDWIEIRRAYKWSEAVTVYRKMKDGNWDFNR